MWRDAELLYPVVQIGARKTELTGRTGLYTPGLAKRVEDAFLHLARLSYFPRERRVVHHGAAKSDTRVCQHRAIVGVSPLAAGAVSKAQLGTDNTSV